MMRVLENDTIIMPDDLKNTYVVCYSAASNHKAAVEKGVESIQAKGYAFDEVREGVKKVSIESWELYLDRIWPEYIDQMPTQVELVEIINNGQVFFSPFLLFSS